MCDVPRTARMSGDPASARMIGLGDLGLDHQRTAWPLGVDDDLRVGDVGDGVERRGAKRVDAEHGQRGDQRTTTSQRNRMTRSMMAAIIGVGLRSLQLVVGVDEKAAERHDLLAGCQAVEHLGVQLALHARPRSPGARTGRPAAGRRRPCLPPDSMIASFGTDRNSTVLGDDLQHVVAAPLRAPGPRERALITTRRPGWHARVTVAWYIDERDSGENARTRWPTLTRAASCGRHDRRDRPAGRVDGSGGPHPDLDRPDGRLRSSSASARRPALR